jgi:hypothetical protein
VAPFIYRRVSSLSLRRVVAQGGLELSPVSRHGRALTISGVDPWIPFDYGVPGFFCGLLREEVEPMSIPS